MNNKLKGRIPRFDDPVNICKTYDGKYKKALHKGKMQFKADKERWDKLFAKPLNKWTPQKS